MPNKQGSNIPWWAIVLGFIFCWPVGMVLLFMSMGGVRIPTEKIKDELQKQSSSTGAQSQTGRRQTPPPTASGSFGQSQSGTTQGTYNYGYGQAAPGQTQRKAGGLGRLFREPKGGKGMTIIGALISFVFSLGLVDELTFAIRTHQILGYADNWFPLLGFLCAGLFLLGKGVSKTRFSRRAKLYQGVIGRRNSVFLSDLAGAAGVSEKKVLSDVQRMLSEGILPMGYIDRASGRLVLTDQGYEPAPEPKKAPPEPEAKKEEEGDALLRRIKAVNDAIPDPEMSKKIDRVGEITKKILDYQRSNPTKAGELQQFLNYYLPTTLKLLNAYAQLDAQGVEGENITAAKRRIEGMMDKVVEGFEKQLDQLFQTDAMDIAADVEVLERMLEKDGLGSGGMTLGGM